MEKDFNFNGRYFVSNLIYNGIELTFNNQSYKTKKNGMGDLFLYIDNEEQNEKGRMVIDKIERIIKVKKVSFNSETHHYYFENNSWHRQILN